MAETFERARSLILERIAPLSSEPVALLELPGRVLAENLIAPCDMPRWNNSAMDGYAVRAEDCYAGARLQISGYIAAGGTCDGLVVDSGAAIKIMTGAPTPAGCQTVVPIENTEKVGDMVTIHQPTRQSEHIRFAGEDIQHGDVVLTTGTLLRPAEISLLASFGFTQAEVYRRPRVAILSTGDELVEPGELVGDGQIINSNAYSLAAAVKEAGGLPSLLGIARDERESLKEKLQEGLSADVLITSAGVSMGDRDLVCEMLVEAGVEQLFWKVNIKPGRPTAFGLKDSRPVFSLPGNPVSTMVTFEEFVRPALLKMQGHQKVIKPFVKARLLETTNKKPGRVQFMRVSVTEDGDQLLAKSSGDQNTGILRTMLRANGIAVLPAERSSFEAGEEVDIHLMNSQHSAINLAI